MIRIARAEDAAAIQRIYAPAVTDNAISFEEVLPTVAEIADRLVATLRMYPWLIVEVEGEVAGYAYAGALRVRSAFRWTVETAIYLDPRFQRRGLGAELYRRLFACLKQQGFTQAYAAITLPNPASVALHEKLAFRAVTVFPQVGYKLGRWHDVGWWQLTVSDVFPNPPAEPIPFPKLPFP